MSEYHINPICIPQLDRPITTKEVRQSIRNLKHGNAPGLGKARGEYLKHAEVNIITC